VRKSLKANETMKKLFLLCSIVLTALLLITAVAGCQQKSQQPPAPAPSPPAPAKRPAPPSPLEISGVAAKPIYLTGEEIEVELAFTNKGEVPITLEPFPPKVGIKRSSPYEVFRSFSAGTGFKVVNPREVATYTLTWDQKNQDGQQVAPGSYGIEVTIHFLYGNPPGFITTPARVLIQHPKGPTPTPLPTLESELPFKINISPSEASYLPGEDIMYGIGITNLSSGTITIDPFPPASQIKPVGQDEAVYWSAAGNRTRDIEPDYPSSWYHTKGFWDQKDNNGEQVVPGWYELSYEYVIIEQNTSKRYTTNLTARFQIVHPDSAMNKDLDINQSVTAEGITVTLERLELNAVNVTVYTFTTPPGYSLPEEHPPYEFESLMINSVAEYSVDGETIKQVRAGGGKANASGIRLTWDDLDPIPADAKKLTFTITQLGEWEGRWEFTVPLGDDSNASQDVTVSQLISQANRYSGKVVNLDAFYFYAVMEINALADSVALEFPDDTKVVPIGETIGLKGDLSQELRNRLYTQESPSPTNTQYFGKLRINGKFAFDDRDSRYYIDSTSTEVLAWTPPPAGVEVPAGNLQIKIQEFSSKPLQGAEVVSSKQPDGQSKLSGLTDNDGMVTFDDIKQGPYEFKVSLADYIQMDIRVTVTGGRTAGVAFSMARVGEAPDDFVPAPGMGPQYRANMIAVRRDGTHVVNPWPSIQSTEVTLGIPSDAMQVTYRDYIESEAGQTRNNIFYIYQPGNGPGDTRLEVILKDTDLPSGITITEDWQWHGPGTQSKTALKIEISPQVELGEYTFNINVEINGKDYGTVPCTIRVIE